MIQDSPSITNQSSLDTRGGFHDERASGEGADACGGKETFHKPGTEATPQLELLVLGPFALPSSKEP